MQRQSKRRDVVLRLLGLVARKATVGIGVSMLTVAASSGCTTTPSEPQPLSGQFQLVAAGGGALPADLGPLIVRPIPPDTLISSACRIQIDGGQLTLDPTTRAFALSWTTRNSCTGSRLSSSSQAGSYSQQGNDLAFEAPNSGAPSMKFAGTIEGERVTVKLSDLELIFGNEAQMWR